ncbi:MAG: hypothetical protein ACF8XB_09780 [Planctomycetota bacterium JB042]
MTINLTPKTIEWENGDVVETADPIRDVLEQAPLDSIVELEPGAYPRPSDIILATRPKLMKGKDDGVRILGKGEYDTLGFGSPDCGRITFARMLVEGSKRYAVTNWMNKGEFEDLAFHDFTIDGGFDHAAGVGHYCKAGFSFNDVSGLSLVRVEVFGIKGEQCCYTRNCGTTPGRHIYAEDIHFHHCGRSGWQDVSRHNENGGKEALGELRIRRAWFHDCGIGEGGGAFTIAGRKGWAYLEELEVDCSPNGNAVTAWAELAPEKGKPGMTGLGVGMFGCRFNGNACKRPTIQLAAHEHVYLSRTAATAGAHARVLEMNAAHFGMGGDVFPVGQLHANCTENVLVGQQWHGPTRVA